MTMQYGEPVPQGKPNSSLEGVTFLWIASGSGCDIMNTLQSTQYLKKHLQPTECIKKLLGISQIILRLHVKANKIYRNYMLI